MTSRPGNRPEPPQSIEADADLDDDLEITLRPPALVVGRALVLAAVCRRAHLEIAPQDLGADDPEGERFDLAGWIVEEGLDPAMTANEHRLLKTRLGKVAREEVVAASWHVEGLAALAWTLGLLEAPPPYDAPVAPGDLLARLPAPWQSTRALRTGATLRPEAEIAFERERAEIWHWRAETASLTAAEPAELKNLRAAIREVAEEAHAAGLLMAVAGHDFPVRGRPYREASVADREALALVTAERLRALNWLCGFGPDWEHVPLDV